MVDLAVVIRPCCWKYVPVSSTGGVMVLEPKKTEACAESFTG
jgi:hypothetical protein